MEKVITAVVTTLLCSFFSGEDQENKASKNEAKKITQVESVEPKRLAEEKIADFDLVEKDLK